MLRTFHAGHAAAMVSAALALTVPVTILATAGPNTPATSAQSGAAPAQATTQEVADEDFPALHVITTLLGEDLTWGAGIPTTPACNAPTPVVSAGRSADGIATTVSVMPAGAGAEAMEQVAKCAQWTETAGDRPASAYRIGDATVEVWQRGDVLVSLTASSAADPTATDQLLQQALADVSCANLNPSVQDAQRNPSRADYTPYTTTHTLTIPQSTITTTVTQDQMPALADPSPEAIPTGIAGPPEPAAVDKPTILTHPGPDPTSMDVAVATQDTVGPGCGWAFTGTVAPVVNAAKLQADVAAADKAARAAMVNRQKKWEKDTQTFNAQWPDWSSKATAWNEYVTSLDAVHTAWHEQTDALSEYAQAKADYDTQASALTAFRTDQQKARDLYNKEVTACATPPDTEPEPTDTPNPSPSDSPTTPPVAVCPPVRPTILDEQPPTVGPQPTAPALWKAGDPLPY